MFPTPPSLFAPPTYLRRKPLIPGSPPEQPQQAVKVPYRPLETANPNQAADTTPLFFRALPSPAQRQQAADAAARQLAARSAAPDPQSTSQPSSAPAPPLPPAPPQQTPPVADTSPQSTEEAPRVVAAQKEAGAQEEAESTLRNPPPTAPAGQQPSTHSTSPVLRSPSQPPSTPAPTRSPAQPQQTPPTASPAPQSAEEEPEAAPAFKEAAAPQSPTPPAPPQPPKPTTAPAAQNTEYDPKVVDAVNKAAAEAEAAEALRKERAPRRTMLESAGLGGTSSSLEALEDEVRTRHAELVKKFPQRGPEYESGMKALVQHIQQQQAQIKAKAMELPEIAARIYQQWGHGIAGNWINEQALTEGDKDSPGEPLSKSHLESLNQEAARYGVDPKDLRHHLEMQRINDWSRGDTSAAVRHGPGGSIWVNPERYLDENAYRQAVEQAWGSEAEKAAAMARFPELQRLAAKAQLDVLRTMGYDAHWEAKQPKGMSDVEMLEKFRREHSGIFSSGAWKIRLRQALVGAVGAITGIAKSAVGAYEATTRSPGAMDLYKKLSDEAAFIRAYSAALPTGQWVYTGTSMVVSTLPSLGVGGLTSLTLKAGGAAFGLRTAAQVAQVAQTWGLRGAAATGGLQTFGSMYGDAVQAYMSSGDSESTALNKAFIPALAGAASTYLLTAAGGTQGVEALLRQPTFKENFRQWFKAVAAGSVKEGLREEAPDQLIQGMIERYTYNPDKPWKEIIEETLHAGIGGALLGGGAEATTTGLTPAKTSQDQPQSSIPSNTTPVAPDRSASDQPPSTSTSGRPSTPPLSVEQSQKLIHNVMNRPPEQRAHPTTQADLAQAQWVVREQVRKLESQTTPLSEAQEKALADAKAALARGAPEVKPPQANGPNVQGEYKSTGPQLPFAPSPNLEWHVPHEPTRHVVPDKPFDAARKPTKPEKVLDKNDKDEGNIRGVNGENETALVLAQNGYDYEQVAQNKKKRPDGSYEGMPDGVFGKAKDSKSDVYSPAARTSMKNIYDSVVGKVDRQKSPYVVVRIEPGGQNIDEITKKFHEHPIEGLKQLFIVKEGKLYIIY